MLQDKRTHPANKLPKKIVPNAHQVAYSTKRVSQHLVNEIAKSLKSIESHGSVEIYIQDSCVTQITVRNIRKTNGYNRSRTAHI